jgi:hypothetical protein
MVQLERLLPPGDRDIYQVDFLMAFLGSFVAFSVVTFADAATFLPADFLTLPMTVNAPALGMTVDSSPVDHLMRRSEPVTPVTTPTRGAQAPLVECI